MKKYIFTETQIKKIIDNQLNEQTAEDREQKRREDSFNAVYSFNSLIISKFNRLY
jgi:hypothetical protein